MNSPFRSLFLRNVGACALAVSLGAFWGTARASAQTNSGSSTYSSSASQSLLSYHAEGQNGGYGNGGYRQYPRYGETSFHHLAIEAGGGFDAPLGNTKGTQTFGYNIKAGAGWNFNRRFGTLIEYEFNRTGIPNSVLAANADGDGNIPQGNVHLWGIGIAPIYYFKHSGAWGGYVTGGAGFYRKVTSFTEPVYEGVVCDYYYGCYPQYGNILINHFSSNQAGLNFGVGLTHNIGDSGAKLYAEARYLWVNSPKSTETQVGSGTVGMIPVTFGIRF